MPLKPPEFLPDRTTQLTSGLPSEFLSTPFGQSMRPQIDAMFRRVTPNEHRVNGSHLPTPPACGSSTPAAANPFGANLLSAVAAQAQASGSTTSLPTPKLTPEAPPLTLVTSSAHFSSILSSTTAVVANFTNTPGCPPCRAIKPAYESIASNYTEQYAAHSVRFVEIELAQGEGNQLASRYGVTATPTFIFFKDGKKAEELRGASKRELEGKVEAFLEDCFPRHPHRKLYLPAIEGISIHPITSSTAPNYPALIGKLEGFAGSDKTQVDILKSRMVPVIQGSSTGQMGTISDSQLNDTVIGWTGASNNLLGSLKPEQTFPIIDLWRIALLVPRLSAVIAVQLSPESPSPEPISPILTLASNTIKESTTSTSKPFLLTVLRLLTNLLSVLPLANILLTTPSRSKTLGTMLEKTTYLVVESLLHPDGSVRKAAADVAVNLATWRHRVAKEQGRGAEDESEPEWSMEIISALLEAIERESDEEVGKLQRLIAHPGPQLIRSPPTLGCLGTAVVPVTIVYVRNTRPAASHGGEEQD